ncbi:hypothetical protein AVEN_95730-1, partial [Araneus ventricosus]
SEVVKSGSAQNVHRITSDLTELKEIVDNLKEIVTPLIGLSKIPGFGNDLNNFHSVNQPETDNLRELNARLAKEVIELRAEVTRLNFSLESYVKGNPPSRFDDIPISSDPFLGNCSLDVPLEQDFNLFDGETLRLSLFLRLSFLRLSKRLSLRTSRSANVVLDWISTHNKCILNTSDPTYFKQGCNPSLVDLSICSPDLLYEIKWTVHNDTFDSDHCPVELSFNYGNTKGPSVRRRIHWGKYVKSLNSILDMENDIHSIQSFERLCNQEKNNNTLIQDMFSKKFPPWWSSECSYLLGQKRKFLRLAKQSSFNPYWKRAKPIAAKLRKRIIHLKRSYWDKLCDNAGSSKTSFRIIRSLRIRDIPQQNAHQLIILEGSNITSPLGQANAFGSMFGSSPISEGIPLDF